MLYVIREQLIKKVEMNAPKNYDIRSAIAVVINIKTYRHMV